MLTYILRRLLLIIPTLLGILLINFVIIQAAPGGPVDKAIARLQGLDGSAGARMGGGGGEVSSNSNGNVKSRGAQGLDPDMIKALEKQYGFDKPMPERFWLMLKNYSHFEFGKSFFKDQQVTDLLLE
ncbi:MAG TPA: microcin ABC transporter permease, partial [Moraxellaceae bacterium]